MDIESFVEQMSVLTAAEHDVYSTEERNRIIDDSLKRCSSLEKSLIIMEELAELSKATSKAYREGNDISRYELIEEMADVLICIRFLKKMYNIGNLELMSAIDIKLRREASRVDNGKNTVYNEEN